MGPDDEPRESRNGSSLHLNMFAYDDEEPNAALLYNEQRPVCIWFGGQPWLAGSQTETAT